jgi:hypothetical protein
MKVETAKRALNTGMLTVSNQGALAGLVLSTPHGQAAPIVVSADELRAIAHELENRADAADPVTLISLREAIKAALGRDPFDVD